MASNTQSPQESRPQQRVVTGYFGPCLQMPLKKNRVTPPFDDYQTGPNVGFSGSGSFSSVFRFSIVKRPDFLDRREGAGIMGPSGRRGPSLAAERINPGSSCRRGLASTIIFKPNNWATRVKLSGGLFVRVTLLCGGPSLSSEKKIFHWFARPSLPRYTKRECLYGNSLDNSPFG